MDDYRARKKQERIDKQIRDRQKQLNTPTIRPGAGASNLPEKKLFKEMTEQVGEKVPQKLVKGKDFLKKIGRGGTGLGALAGIISAASSGDASAAIPVVNDMESLGESAQDENMKLAEMKSLFDYEKSPAGRAAKENLDNDEKKLESRRRALASILDN